MTNRPGKRATCWFGWLVVALLVTNHTNAQECTLPTFGSWNTGLHSRGYTPDFQVQMLRDGHRITPWFQLPVPGETMSRGYYAGGIAEARARHLPITLISTQWESLLSKAPYLVIQDDTNPNVLPSIGNPVPKVSPFGSDKYWYEVGLKWTRQPTITRLQELYPDPPTVIFLSNNEHPKLKWYELEQDKRYLREYSAVGNLFDFESKRKLTITRWQSLYHALQQGMLDGLTNETWKKNAKFVGYLATGSAELGKKLLWERDALFTDSAMDPYPLFWDGGSFSYYSKHDLRSIAHNPAIEAMNIVFMNEFNRQRYPEHYFEMSIWDGHTYDATDTRRHSERREPGSSLANYVAMTKFGAWLLRPSLIREFRFYTESVLENRMYTDAIIELVDEINESPILKQFWCAGELVSNRTRQHPYNTRVPEQYARMDRWFMLNNSLDDTTSWSSDKTLKVFALALRIHTAPNRRWLIYAHSTDSSTQQVRLEIPEYKNIQVSVSTMGKYHVVDEATGAVTPVPSLSESPTSHVVTQ